MCFCTVFPYRVLDFVNLLTEIVICIIVTYFFIAAFVLRLRVEVPIFQRFGPENVL